MLDLVCQLTRRHADGQIPDILEKDYINGGGAMAHLCVPRLLGESDIHVSRRRSA